MMIVLMIIIMNVMMMIIMMIVIMLFMMTVQTFKQYLQFKMLQRNDDYLEQINRTNQKAIGAGYSACLY